MMDGNKKTKRLELNFKIGQADSKGNIYSEKNIKKAFKKSIEKDDLYIVEYSSEKLFEVTPKILAKVKDFSINNKKILVDVLYQNSALKYFNKKYWGLYPSFVVDNNNYQKIDRIYEISIRPINKMFSKYPILIVRNNDE